MTIAIDVQFAVQSSQLPGRHSIFKWVRKAFADHPRNTGLSIRIVGEDEGVELNRRWRQINTPTNVLSFPAGDIEVVNHRSLGDIVICAPVIEREAGEQGKTAEAHYAHMVIHGVLHLLGYDHQKAEDAEKMEAMEAGILANLGFADPYTME